jgi:hypothetical protein
MTDTEMLLDAIKGYQHGRIGMSRDVREAFTALLRRDWSVRVLDAWAKGPKALEWCITDCTEQVCCSLETTVNGGDVLTTDYYGPTPDAARHAAALAVFATLPADVRAKLGECP